MMWAKDLTIIIPVYNEEPSIGLVIDEIRSLGLECDILVVNNNSINGTLRIVQEKQVKYINETRQGKGYALQRGMEACNTPYFIVTDGDFTYPSEYVLPMYHILCTRADVVVGVRVPMHPEAMAILHRVGNYSLNTLASVLLKRRVYDLCSGLRGFRTEAARELLLNQGGFVIEAEMTSKSIKSGLRFEQIPIDYRVRVGRAKLRFTDGFSIAYYLLEELL